MTFDQEPEYVRATQDFESLRVVLPRFAEHKVWMRGSEPLSPRITSWVAPGPALTRGAVRDAAVCALVNKGCNTHVAVKTLTDAGNGDDAMVLARVLMETAIVLRWVLLDRPYRLDLYCLSTALFRRRWTQLVKEYFSSNPGIMAVASAGFTPEDAAVADAAFGNTHYKWSRERQPDGKFRDVSLQNMLQDIEEHEAASIKEFFYQVSYFMHSSHAHAASDGLRQFRTLGRQRYFTCELGFNNGECASALQGANVYLCWLLQSACEYLGLRDVEHELDAWFAAMTAAMKASHTSQAAQTAATP